MVLYFCIFIHLPKDIFIFLTMLNVYFEVLYAAEHHACKTGILESSNQQFPGEKSIYHLLASLKYMIEEEELNWIFTSSALPGVHSAEVIYSSLYRKQNPSKNQPQFFVLCICIKIEQWAFFVKNRVRKNNLSWKQCMFSRIPI